MLQVEYRLKLGQDEFVLKAEVKDEKEFFETMSFYSSLPRTAPGGTADLKIAFRTTREGHKYYSLISEKEKMEFKLGQNKENQGGGLFPKGWEPLYEGNKEEQDQAPQQRSAAPIVVGQQAPTPQPAAAPPVQQPAFVPPTVMPTPQQFTAPAPVAAPQPAAAAPTPAANPAVTAAANNVLSRFGINK